MERQDEINKAEAVEQEPNLNEVIAGFKKITLPKVGEVELHRPSFHVIEAGDKIAASTKSKLLKDKTNDYLTTAELKKIYSIRGSWTEEDDFLMDALREKIIFVKNELRLEAEEDYKMESAGTWIDQDDKELQELCKAAFLDCDADLKESDNVKKYRQARSEKLAEFRKKYSNLRDTHNELFGNTIESFSNYERHIFYCTLCYKKDGKYVWGTVDELKSEPLNVFSEAVSSAVKFWNGMDSEEMQSFFGELLEG